MLDMNETGTKMTTRLSVVAMTGSPISAVAAFAASNGPIFFSSMKRKMFSSTTIASSMTMPTISTSASIVTLLSVKSSAPIMPKVAMTEVGIATPAMIVARQLRMNSEHDQAREDAAEHQVQVDLVQRRVDVARLVADDLELHVARQLRRDALEAGLDAFDDRDRVRARLPADLQSVTVGTPSSRASDPLLLGAVLGPADVADADRRRRCASR